MNRELKFRLPQFYILRCNPTKKFIFVCASNKFYLLNFLRFFVSLCLSKEIFFCTNARDQFRTLGARFYIFVLFIRSPAFDWRNAEKIFIVFEAERETRALLRASRAAQAFAFYGILITFSLKESYEPEKAFWSVRTFSNRQHMFNLFYNWSSCVQLHLYETQMILLNDVVSSALALTWL